VSAATQSPVLHHVNLKTRRLDEMVDWYGLVVGMKPNHKGPEGAWLSNDDANHRLALLTTPGLKDDPEKLVHTGMHHIGFELESVSALLDTYERLATHGHLPHASLDHGMTTSFYYVDPDGNSVELQADNFGGDWQQSSAFLGTPEFAANPIGQTIDPVLMLRAREEGATDQELHERGYAGEFKPDEPLDLRLP